VRNQRVVNPQVCILTLLQHNGELKREQADRCQKTEIAVLNPYCITL
jgi:hypothetical protein